MIDAIHREIACGERQHGWHDNVRMKQERTQNGDKPDGGAYRQLLRSRRGRDPVTDSAQVSDSLLQGRSIKELLGKPFFLCIYEDCRPTILIDKK
jgi:hypothetical protein